MAEVYRHTFTFTNSDNTAQTSGLHSGMIIGVFAVHSENANATFTLKDDLGYNLLGDGGTSGNVNAGSLGTGVTQIDQETMNGTAIAGNMVCDPTGNAGTLTVTVLIAP